MNIKRMNKMEALLASLYRVHYSTRVLKRGLLLYLTFTKVLLLNRYLISQSSLGHITLKRTLGPQ
jgi:hypothetical protein